MAENVIRQPSVSPGRRGAAPLVFAVVETTVTAVAALCWILLALAMYMEAYDQPASYPGRPEGHAELAYLACGMLVSLAVTWTLRLVTVRAVWHIVNGLIAARLVTTLVITTVLTVDLLNG
ncbi:hypothetical protein [Streptomyces roseolilacinus]|uniref:hypothetical protein n=1 Tax=Streptomyces roseolilacinus TaxID=66904 RepID=UPI003827E8D0